MKKTNGEHQQARRFTAWDIFFRRKFGLAACLCLIANCVSLYAASELIDGPNGKIEILYEVSNGMATIYNSIDWAEHNYVDHDELVVSYWVDNGIQQEVDDVYGFLGCAIDPNAFGSITLPSTLGGHPVVSIGENAFHGCSGLTSITIPDSVTSIGDNAFDGCSGLVSPVYNLSTSVLWHVDATLSGNFAIPNGVTNIGRKAFQGCANLTSIDIPSGLVVIGDYAFQGCSSLTSATIPDGVTRIGNNAFHGCSKLASLTIPGSVESIGNNAFQGCSSLVSITILDGVKSIGDNAFKECSKLESLAISDSVESIGDYAFSGCTKLTQPIFNQTGTTLCFLPDTFKETIPSMFAIPEGVKRVFNHAFECCFSLESITIPSSVTNVGDMAFAYCYRLSSVNIVDLAAWCQISFGAHDANPINCTHQLSLNGEVIRNLVIPNGVTAIGDYAFYGCSTLTSVTIPDSVTHIGECAFAGCSGLTSITIPESVTSIGDYAFRNCSGLVSIVIPESVTNIGRDAFKGCGCQSTSPIQTIFQASIVSAQMRESDPTVMDVTYVVRTNPETTPTVNVRALAFEHGVRSFAKVVRPKTFIEGTDANIGDGIAANVEHRLSWKVSSDWAADLTKVKFEILAMKSGDWMLPNMHFVTIPGEGGQSQTQFSINRISDADLFKALTWCYADDSSDLSLSGGRLYGWNGELANGTSVSRAQAIRYIGDKYGYRLSVRTEEWAWVKNLMRQNLPENEQLVKNVKE